MHAPLDSTDPGRFASVLRRFDAENAADPNRIALPDGPQPYELAYARWLTDWLLRLCPDASEALRLAARCQHLRRWMIPRETYPPTRAGYLQWRQALKQFHADQAAEILRDCGYPEVLVKRVQALNLKANFPNDPESRVLEDALCLVFLERQFAELAAKSPDDKMIGALQKAWKKMTPAAQAAARGLTYGEHEQLMLARALGPSALEG